VDYGYSKRLDEALEHWERQDVLRDMVRAIRRFRPLVVVSRWQGTDRDGHGQHQAAGALTPQAVRLAADAAAFPELRHEGMRPWRVRKLYVGGVRDSEPWQVRVETGVHDPVLGASYNALGQLGLSIQRSQSSGRFDPYAQASRCSSACARKTTRLLRTQRLRASRDSSTVSMYGCRAPTR
jgi:hypothetical protein